MLILCFVLFIPSSDEESSQIFVPFVNVSITILMYYMLIIKIENVLYCDSDYKLPLCSSLFRILKIYIQQMCAYCFITS